MRKIREVLRLKFECNLSAREIALACQMGTTTTKEYLGRFTVSGLSWPLPDDMDDEFLEKKLFPGNRAETRRCAPPNYIYLMGEMKKPNVTLEILWEEYCTENPAGYQYSYFAYLYREYCKTLNYSMRQEHKAGEKGFVDFGEGLTFFDRERGEAVTTKLFVFVWGASGKTYARATLGEDLPSWIHVNVTALEYFGCAPKAIVPDNLKSAVTKACRYEPQINPTYAEFAAHYGVAILPARPYRPKDKALVENGVRLAKRLILAKLRNRIFETLEEMNLAISELLELLNGKMMKRFGKSRSELFEVLDVPHALRLPEVRYEYAEWKKVRVNINYHIEFDHHSYSVPYTLIHQELMCRGSFHTLEIYKGGQRILSHKRSRVKHGYTTVRDHMPLSHQKYVEWTPERILSWAGQYGPSVKELATSLIAARNYPEQAYKSLLGILRLGERYPGRLENACGRALAFHSYSYQAVKNILQRGLDTITTDTTEAGKHNLSTLLHENIRGPEYFGEIAKDLKDETKEEEKNAG